MPVLKIVAAALAEAQGNQQNEIGRYLHSMGELMDNENKRHHDELKTLHDDIGRIRDQMARGVAPQLVSEEIQVQSQPPPVPAKTAAASATLAGLTGVKRRPATTVGDAVMDISERSDSDSLPGAEADGKSAPATGVRVRDLTVCAFAKTQPCPL